MKKDIRIDGRLHRVFVLTENKDRLLYIPLKNLTKVHYDQLTKISESNPTQMLEEMRKTTLQNGRNALATFDSIIQVLVKESDTEGTRLPKPEEAIGKVQQQTAVREQQVQPVQQVNVDQPQDEPQRRKPGPKPKQ
jgi:hypothetical protein